MGAPVSIASPCRIAASGWLVFLLAMAALFWLCRLLKVLRGLLSYWDIRRFYGEALRIPAVSGAEGMPVGQRCRCRGVGSIAVLLVPEPEGCRCRGDDAPTWGHQSRGGGAGAAVGTPVPWLVGANGRMPVPWGRGGGAGAVAVLDVTTGLPVPRGWCWCHRGAGGSVGTAALWGRWQRHGDGGGAAVVPEGYRCRCGDVGSVAAVPGLTQGLWCPGAVSAVVVLAVPTGAVRVAVPTRGQRRCRDGARAAGAPVPTWGQRCHGGAVAAHGNGAEEPSATHPTCARRRASCAATAGRRCRRGSWPCSASSRSACTNGS